MGVVNGVEQLHGGKTAHPREFAGLGRDGHKL